MSDAPEPLSALLDRIEALAAKATPGPKRRAPATDNGWDIVDVDGAPIAFLMNDVDAAYLASFDPATVRRLIAAVLAWEALAEAASRAADALVEDPSSYIDIADRLHEAVASTGRKA